MDNWIIYTLMILTVLNMSLLDLELIENAQKGYYSIFQTKLDRRLFSTYSVQVHSIGVIHDDPKEVLEVSEMKSEHLDPNSPSFLRDEVEAIVHFPMERKIEVHFKRGGDRKCNTPRIFGRLSGPYLSIINWDHEPYLLGQRGTSDATTVVMPSSSIITKTRDSITGYYEVPSAGRYFVEILGLLCNDFNFDDNFNHVCLEDPSRNRLTSINSFIDVSIATSIRKHSNSIPFGYWKWANKDNSPIPLQTRYQGQNCRDEKENEPACLETSSIDRFDPYSFEWSGSYDNSLLFRDPMKDDFILCFGGQSHARLMRDHCKVLVSEYKLTNVKCLWISMRYPNEMNDQTADTAKRDCTNTVVAIGQWPAGRDPNKGMLFPVYMESLRAGIKVWKDLGVDFMLRPVHYNPLGDVKLKCPPQDHRSPPVIDGYNEIVRALAKEYSIPYIHADYIHYPMWDSGEDFCHYDKLNGKIEVLSIMIQVLQSFELFEEKE